MSVLPTKEMGVTVIVRMRPTDHTETMLHHTTSQQKDTDRMKDSSMTC